MQLVAPDILERLGGLSPYISATALVVGVLLWLFGGLTHRFWVVLSFTLIAGLYGFSHAKEFGMSAPLIGGLLLAISVGALALSLFRITLFVASGFGFGLLASTWGLGWTEQIVAFLAGGLLGLGLHRLCITLLASFGGTLLIFYAGLVFLGTWLGSERVVGLATDSGTVLNWGIASGTVLGMLVQFLIQRRRKGSAKKSKAEVEEEEAKKEKGRIWQRMLGIQRKAG